MQVGDTVICRCVGSWADGKTGTIAKVNVLSPDGIHGHLIQFADRITVMEEFELTVVENKETKPVTSALVV